MENLVKCGVYRALHMWISCGCSVNILIKIQMSKHADLVYACIMSYIQLSSQSMCWHPNHNRKFAEIIETSTVGDSMENGDAMADKYSYRGYKPFDVRV